MPHSRLPMRTMLVIGGLFGGLLCHGSDNIVLNLPRNEGQGVPVDRAAQTNRVTMPDSARLIEGATAPRPFYYPTDNLHVPRYNLCRNLIQNPSFEAGLRYWYHKQWPGGGGDNLESYSMVIDATNGINGGKCLRLIGGSPVVYSFAVPVVPGNQYVLSFYCRGLKGNRQGARLNVELTGAVASDRPLRASVGLDKPEWQRHSFPVKAPSGLLTARFQQENGGTKDQCWIDDVQLEAGAQPTDFTAKPAIMELLSDSPDNLFQSGQSVACALRVKSRPDCAGTIAASLRDFTGTEVWRDKLEFKTDAQGEARMPLRIKTASLQGLYVLRADIRAGDYADYDFFRLGFMRFLNNTHKHKNMVATPLVNIGAESMDKALERHKRIGVGAWFFDSMQCVPPAKVTALAERHGLLTMSALFYGCEYSLNVGTGEFYVNVGTNRIPYFSLSKTNYAARQIPEFDPETIMPNLGQIGSNVYRVVKAHPEIKYWKTVNEPVFFQEPGRVEAFVKFLKEVARNIRAANPQAKIFSPDPSNMEPHIGQLQIENYIEHGLLDACDIIAIHAYGGTPEHFDPQMDQFLAMLAKHGFKGEVWLTEGMCLPWYVIPGFELLDDKWDFKVLSYDLGHGEQMTFAHSMRQWLMALKHSDRVKMQADWGLKRIELDSANTPRALVWAPNVLMNILGNADFRQEIELIDNLKIYMFEDEAQRPVAVVWRCDDPYVDGPAKPMRLRLAGERLKMEFFDAMGQSVAVRPDDIPATSFPLFVRGRSNQRQEFVEAWRQAEVVDAGGGRQVSFAARIADTNAYELTVRNCVARPTRGTLALRTATGEVWRADVTLTGFNSSVVHSVAMPLGGTLFSPLELKTTFACAGSSNAPDELNDAVRLMVCPKRQAPITIDGDLADWPASSAIKLPNTFAEFPVPRNLRERFPAAIPWGGTNDLSAQLYLAWDDDRFYLALRVRDDQFCPPPAGELVPQHVYDSLQVYFDPECDARARLPQTGWLNDYQYNLVMASNQTTVTADVVPDFQIALFRPGPVPDVVAAVKRVDNFTVYEMAIPVRRLLPIRLASGSVFGFAVLVNDNDNDYRKRGLTLTPQGTEPWMAPHLYPTVILK